MERSFGKHDQTPLEWISNAEKDSKGSGVFLLGPPQPEEPCHKEVIPDLTYAQCVELARSYFSQSRLIGFKWVPGAVMDYSTLHEQATACSILRQHETRED